MLERADTPAFLDRVRGPAAHDPAGATRPRARSYLTIAIGCTGGRHRSVAIAEELARRLRARGSPARTTHRDVVPRADADAERAESARRATCGSTERRGGSTTPPPRKDPSTMTVRVGINGFGRIGRNLFRAAKERGADIDFVAVNDLGVARDDGPPAEVRLGARHRCRTTIKATKNGIKVDGDELQVLSVRNPAELPWGELGVDLVIESTGFFTARDKAAAHLDAGAPLVVVSAPSRRRRRHVRDTASTTRTSTPRRTRSSPTPAARRTASCRWSRCSTTRSASSRA